MWLICFIAGLPLGWDMRCLPMLVHLSFICCLSHSHISKIKQDRPTVTMECYIEVGTGDFVATFRSPHTLLGRYRGLKLKKLGSDINTAVQARPSVISQVLSTEHIGVVNWARPSLSHRCCQLSTQVLSTEHDRRYTTGVVNWAWQSLYHRCCPLL